MPLAGETTEHSKLSSWHGLGPAETEQLPYQAMRTTWLYTALWMYTVMSTKS